MKKEQEATQVINDCWSLIALTCYRAAQALLQEQGCCWERHEIHQNPTVKAMDRILQSSCKTYCKCQHARVTKTSSFLRCAHMVS